MPLTLEQKRRFLQRIGKNPDEFDYDESSGRIVPLAKEQPTTAPITTAPTTARPVAQDDPGALGVFGRSFARGAIPSVGGLGGGVLGAELGLLGGPFAPVTVPLGAIGGAITGSILTGKAQEKALTEFAPGVQQYLDEGAQQHPIASTLGSVSSGIIGMKPSLQNLRTAGRGIRNLATGVETSAAQKGAVLNVGLGAGLGAGQSIYEDVRQGEDVNLLKALISTTGGALLSEPNRIGRALGVAPSQQDMPAITGVSERQIGSVPIASRRTVSERPTTAQTRFTPEGQTMRQQMLTDEIQLARESELAAETGYDPATGKRIEELAYEGDPFMIEQRRKNAELKMQLRIARAQKQSTAESVTLAKQLAKEREELALQRAQAAQDEQLALATDATTAAQINTPSREFGVSPREDVPLNRFREGYEVTEQRLARERGRTRTPERTTAKPIEFTPEQRAIEFTRPLEELPTKPYDITAPKRETAQPRTPPTTVEPKIGFKVPTKTEDILGAGKVKLREAEEADARYAGTFDYSKFNPKLKPTRFYNLNRDIVDAQGNVTHVKNSTVSENELQKLGLKYDTEAGKQQSTVKLRESDEAPKQRKPIDNLKLISFKDQLDASVEQRVEKGKELFKQAGLNVGDVLYSPKGTAMTIVDEGISVRKDGRPLVYVKYNAPDGSGEVRGTAYLDMLSIDDPLDPKFRMSEETVNDNVVINTIDQTERAPIFEPAAPKGEASKVPQWFVNYMDKLGIARNVKIDKTTGDLSINGKSVDGMAFAREGIREALNKVKLNRADNLPHEMFHTFLDDMKQSKSNLGKKLAKQAEEVITNSEEYKQWSSQRKSKGQEDSAEEFLVEKVGTDFWKRVSEQKFGKEFLKDFWSFVKARYSSKASLDDVVRVMSNKLRFDAPFSETHGIAPKVTTQTDTEEQKTGEVKERTQEDFTPLYDETPLQSGTKSRFSFLRTMEPAFDKVKRHNTEAGEALHNFATRQDQLKGQFINEPLLKIREAGISGDVLKSVMDKMRSIFRGDTDVSSVQFEGDELVARDILQELFGKVRDLQNEVGLKIGGFRKAGKNEWYVPDMMSDETINTLVKTPNSAEANSIKNDWAQYLMEQDSKITPQEAKELIDNYTNALGNSKLTPTVKFGALDKAMGLGLPESMRETNGLRIVEKYGRRSAKRLATFMELESIPEVAAALGFKNQETGKLQQVEGIQNITNEPDVQQALKFVYDNFETGAGEYAQAATRLVNNALLGAGTGIRDLASVPVNTAPYVGIRDLPVYLTALKDISSARKESLLTNARSKNLDALQWKNIQNPDEAVGWLNKIATALRVGQGREHLEQASRIYTFAIGKQLAKDNYMRALNGDEKAKAFLEKFGRLSEDLQTTENLDAQFNQIAKNFVDRVQGTYDGRGLPTGIMEGPFSPYLTLSKWGVEKANVIYQDVINPALKDNNYTPLLMYTLGSLMTGAGIRELNEIISNKKDQTPSVKEALAADNKPQLVASVINLLQQGSFAGIVSDAMRMGADTFISGEKPRGLSFPAADFAVNLTENISDWSSAIQQGADKFDTTLALIHKTLKDTVQNWRLIANNVMKDDKEAAERGDKFRDKRVFSKLQGDEVPPAGSFRTNPFEDKKIKQFKRTNEPKEAGKLAREITQELTVLAKSNRRAAMQKLKNLGRNNYQTFPNPETDPQGALQYFNFLVKTQGKEEAVNRFADFQRQNRLNREKSKIFR